MRQARPDPLRQSGPVRKAWVNKLHCAVLAGVLSIPRPQPICSQAQPEPTTPRSALEIVTRDLGQMREQLAIVSTAADSSRIAPSAGVPWASACCAPQIAEMRSLHWRLDGAIRSVAATRTSAREDPGHRLARRMEVPIAGLARSLDSLAVATDSKSARIAITHLTAGLEAMTQMVAGFAPSNRKAPTP